MLHFVLQWHNYWTISTYIIYIALGEYQVNLIKRLYNPRAFLDSSKVRQKLTWPGSSIMVTPASVLWITTCYNSPFMTFHGRITNLQWHFSNQLFPTWFNKIHYCWSLLGSCQRWQNCYTITQAKPTEIHSCWTNISNEVTATTWHEIEHPFWKGVRHYIELVNCSVRVFLCLVTIYII